MNADSSFQKTYRPAETRGDISVLPADFMQDPHRARQDAITAAKLIRLGVVEEETACALLRGAYRMASLALSKEDSRAFKRACDVIFAATKLELQARANEIEQYRSRMPQIHGHIHYDSANAVRHRLAEINSRLGITNVD